MWDGECCPSCGLRPAKEGSTGAAPLSCSKTKTTCMQNKERLGGMLEGTTERALQAGEKSGGDGTGNGVHPG